jgi:hypothetical protein
MSLRRTHLKYVIRKNHHASWQASFRQVFTPYAEGNLPFTDAYRAMQQLNFMEIVNFADYPADRRFLSSVLIYRYNVALEILRVRHISGTERCGSL